MASFGQGTAVHYTDPVYDIQYKISAKLYAQMIGYEISIDFLSLKKFRVFLLKLQSLIKNTLVLYHIPKKL